MDPHPLLIDRAPANPNLPFDPQPQRNLHNPRSPVPQPLPLDIQMGGSADLRRGLG
ncbi:unnamed protein product [Tuber aestivum]|uniref:Uncharacterized protein n=1 Tax=Tuber aestivum TaxID=59557 RepID=A0A292PWV9_9PEZI|nr:unnamed protein product [Tuber aestivum]